MIILTKTAAKVVHGHAQKPGSPTDKPKGATIKSYSFAKYGKAEAIQKAHAMHYAIMMSEKRRG
jgi:hypothetical protein